MPKPVRLFVCEMLLDFAQLVNGETQCDRDQREQNADPDQKQLYKCHPVSRLFLLDSRYFTESVSKELLHR